MSQTGRSSALPDAALFEQAACGLLVAETQGTVLRVNATLCNWLGYEANDLVGKRRAQDLFSMGGQVFYQTHCKPLLQMQGSVAEVQLDILHRNGTRIPVLINIVRQTHGEQTFDEFALFIAMDRQSYERELRVARATAEASLEARREAETKLMEINQQLSLADRRKDEFLATLAHELRNPMAPMRNVLEILKLRTSTAATHDWALQVLERQLKQMTHLVDDLMEVSRITQGRIELRRQPIDLAAVLKTAVEDARPMIEASSHRFEVILPHEPIIIDADVTRVTQVLVNLLTNAAKYTPKGGVISLRAERQRDDAVIWIRDSGIGIPKESLSTIFDMFSQLEPALGRSKDGLGIGLALVRGLVELHGGCIEATSDGLGAGSEFIIRLPITSAPLPECNDGPAITSTRRRILIIDDNGDAAETMTMMLDMLGYETRTAFTGASGLQTAADFKPAVILLDIGLPDMNGYDVVSRIRQEAWGTGICVIAATGWGQASDLERARDAGFDHHLTKPIDIDKLQTMLSQL